MQVGSIEIVYDYVIVLVFGFVCLSVLNYNNIEALITNFLKQKKIIRLFQEQNTIFDELPGGLILYREDQSQEIIQIHHINKLFK